jgi:hypothetical protein
MGSIILTDKQKLALELRRKLGSDEAVANAMGLKNRESACRLLNRGRRRLRGFEVLAAAANGGDALSAINDVRRVFAA